MMKEYTDEFVKKSIENTGEKLKELISGMHYLINNQDVIIQWQKKK